MSAAFDCSALIEGLEGFALVADKRADDLIDDLVVKLRADPAASPATTRSEMLPDVIAAIASGVDTDIDKFLNEGDELNAIIEDNLDLIKRAQNYFDDHGVAIITALFHASLPEAYLGMRGVQVLDITGELFNNWSRRVQETGQFLVNVLSPTPDLWRYDKSSLTAGEFGARAARRVRLTHAAVRWMLLDECPAELRSLLLEGLGGVTVWQARMIDIAHEGDRGGAGVAGAPLNQEDLVATLGTFTTVVIRALERLGLTVDDDDRTALYFLWNVVAWHMGIGAREAFVNAPPTPRASAWNGNCMLPLTVDEMDCVYDNLAAKLQGETTQGRRMSKALFQELSYPLPRAMQAAPAFVARYLVGNAKADWLAIEQGGYAELAISGSGALDRFARSAHTRTVRRLSVELLSRYVTRYALRAFIAQARWSERGLKIDPRVAGKWGIQMPPEPRSPLPAGSNKPMRV